MKKREVTELKRRLSKKNASFSRLAGCYVDMNRNKVCSFNRQFLTLAEDEFFKYLEIAAKVLSGAVGNNLLDLEFPREAEAEGGSQALLMAIRDSELEDEALLDAWYDRIIASYKKVGNYLILLYMDRYDVPCKATDGFETGESEEVYRYVLSAICPVELSDPGLGYREEENAFGARSRDWVVGAPETGFLFPAFNDRSSDIHGALFYTKDAKEPHQEVMQDVLGCRIAHTATEQRLTFGAIVSEVLGDGDEAVDQALDVQQNLRSLEELRKEETKGDIDQEEEPYFLEQEVVHRALSDTRIPDDMAAKIEKKVGEVFAEERPLVKSVIDSRALKNNEIRLERNALEEQLLLARQEVKSLKEAAGETANGDYDVVLTVAEEKAPYVRYGVIGGERFLLIPVEAYESVVVNGEEQ